MVESRVVEEVGVVRSIKGPTAVVCISRKSACEGCSMEICRPDEQFMEIEAFNSAEAHVGNKVRVVMKPYSYLKSSCIVYGIPALALFIGAVLGKQVLSHYLKMFSPDTISAMFAFGAFAASFIIVRRWSATFSEKGNIKPVIKEILEE
jgi:sigma-E factor negative regulatory protein RseC